VPVAGRERPEDDAVEIGEDLRPGLLVAAPPGGHRLEEEILPEQRPAHRRQEGTEGGVFDEPRAEGVGQGDVASARRLRQAGRAEQRIRPELEGVAPRIVDETQHDVGRLQPAHGPDGDPAAPDGEVGARHQRVAEVPGQVGVFREDFCSGAGAQDHRARAVVLPPVGEPLPEPGQRRAQRVVEAVDALDPQGAVEVGMQAGEHPAGAQHGAEAPGDRRPVASHPPCAARAPGEVHGGDDQPAGHREPGPRA
jgi:hypothetical protein